MSSQSNDVFNRKARACRMPVSVPTGKELVKKAGGVNDVCLSAVDDTSDWP